MGEITDVKNICYLRTLICIFVLYVFGTLCTGISTEFYPQVIKLKFFFREILYLSSVLIFYTANNSTSTSKNVI